MNDAKVPYSTFVLDRDGRLLSTFEEQRRERVSLDEVPPVLQQATIAIEDRASWTSPGVEPGAILRAFVTSWREGRVAQGGSTITQQKGRILGMYLEQVCYGNRSYGVKTAAKAYFGVSDLWTLALGRAALLAGLPQRPTVYDPVTNLAGAKARSADVLAAMVQAGFISADRAAQADSEPIAVKPAVTPLALPHVVYRVRDELTGILGSERAVTWAATASRQRSIRSCRRSPSRWCASASRRSPGRTCATRRSSRSTRAPGTSSRTSAASITATRTRRCAASSTSRASASGRGGSTFKLFTYLAASRRGFTPSSILWDVSTNFAPPGQPPYRPQNASPTGYGAGPENAP
ncbi:MAG: hypothetical protein FJ028_06905 [Chloroflexi bacterium]|nr:hypothetical protein [Chloroflexota bacterium]